MSCPVPLLPPLPPRAPFRAVSAHIARFKDGPKHALQGTTHHGESVAPSQREHSPLQSGTTCPAFAKNIFTRRDIAMARIYRPAVRSVSIFRYAAPHKGSLVFY